MFSPDHFYFLLRNRYGYPQTKNVIYVPKYHGAKKFVEFISYTDGEFKEKYLNEMIDDEKMDIGCIIMHDQEPLMDLEYFTGNNNVFDNPLDKINLSLKTAVSPIWCHSEKNSQEVEKLKQNGYIDCYFWYHGFISLEWFRFERWHFDLEVGNKNKTAKKFLLYARDFSGTRNYRKTLVESLKSMKQDIIYDWRRVQNIDSSFSAKIDPDDALNSHIQIVAETIFETDKIHLTEKIFKPIVMNQPFILVGPAGGLEYLRSYGFKTFSSLWNEDYDLEKDHDKRLLIIVELIKKLNSLDKIQFDNIVKNATEITNFNRKRFYSQDFYTMLIEELETNMEIALEKQASATVQQPGGTWYSTLNRFLLENKKVEDKWINLTINHMKKLNSTTRNKILLRYKEIKNRIQQVNDQ